MGYKTRLNVEVEFYTLNKDRVKELEELKNLIQLELKKIKEKMKEEILDQVINHGKLDFKEEVEHTYINLIKC